MDIPGCQWVRRLLLPAVCVAVLLGLSACGGSNAPVACPDDENGAEWVWTGTVCSLRRDGFNWSVSSIAVALDGSDDLYALGSFTHFKNTAVKPVVRLNNNGSLDSAFDIDNVLFAPTVVAAATDGSGKLYIGGQLESGGGTQPDIARFNLDGGLDTSFDTGPGFGRSVSTIVPTTDGSGDVYVGGIAILGVATFTNGPVRLNSDGSRDTDFDPGFRSGQDAIALTNDSSGDIYVSLGVPPYIARLNDDGSLDGVFDTGVPGFDSWVTHIAEAADGSGDVYVAGYFTEFNGTEVHGLARLNRDGTLDTGFDVDEPSLRGGRFVVPVPDGSGDVYANARGFANESIVRLNDDGSIDTGFGSGTEGVNCIGIGTIGDVAIAADGSDDVYLAGDLTRCNSRSVAMLVRVTPQGVLVD